jgi:hypothetical protein
MNAEMITKLRNYINSQSRNKIIFHCQKFSDFKSINIGELISESIFNFKEHNRVALRASSEINEILNSAISHHEVFGMCLSIENIGILFEPELKIDFVSLLDKFSQNNVLFVKWEGEIDTDDIYFLSKENGIKINIKNLSHITI